MELWRTAAELVRNRIPLWRDLWRDGPLAHAVTTGDYLDNLDEGESSYLASAAVQVATPTMDRLGMCGHLTSWAPALV